MQTLCVFCGSNPGRRPEYAAAAEALGGVLARRGIGLVYGGANVGLMGLVARAALAGGGRVIGVLPAALRERELAHHGLTELHIVGSMHERKALMADLADGFIAMPGGFGTFEEFCEVLTWTQLGLQRKPCGLLNVADFYAPLLALFDHATAEGFVRPEHRAMVAVDSSPEALIDALSQLQLPATPKWLRRSER